MSTETTNDELRKRIAALEAERDGLAAALDVYETWRKDRKHFHDEWLAAGRTFDALPERSQARIEAEANLVVIMEESIGPVDPQTILAARDEAKKREGAVEELMRWAHWGEDIRRRIAALKGGE